MHSGPGANPPHPKQSSPLAFLWNIAHLQSDPTSSDALTTLGWSPELAGALAHINESQPVTNQLLPSRVCVDLLGGFRVLTADSPPDGIPAALAGKLHKDAIDGTRPAVGDWVAIRPPANADSPALIEHLLPRRTKFSRRAAGKRAVEQVLAANIDTVFIVASLEKRLRPRSLERYLTLTKHSGAGPVIVLTKSDLCDDPDAARAEVQQAVGDIPVHTVSALTSDDASEKLRPYLIAGKTATVLGMSGAGKSTLVNHWAGQQTIATGDVRDSDRRGRHTTTHRHLIQLPWGAVVIDTPGMRELQLWETGKALRQTFEDVEATAAHCKFSNCSHTDDPGCAVVAATKSGELDPGRVASFLKLKNEKTNFDAGAARTGRTQAATRRRKGRKWKRTDGPSTDPDPE